ncbi:branched-chain amino acid aminotransferase [Candidatus Karelsulcia muelleri]|uniref:branched-chain amino acid aminotransferase n=1 Tax=Candidatus Karelsulcia muelleri TaxID=336810 RepID=UPI0019510633|nr:branched-chain amino acid aminotransferase [Candidatus Karelsulcia muelleri]
MRIEKCQISSIDKINWEIDIPFGKYFSDHILYCEYKNETWNEPIIKPFSNFSFSPITLVFHYGQAIFEGMKAFKDKEKNVFLFRPLENFHRLNISAKRLAMPTIPYNIFFEGLINLLNLDKNWIPMKYGYSLYIRPFMIASAGPLSAKPSSNYIFLVICTPVNNYYSRPLKVKIEQKYSRSTNGGIGFIKAAGNYAASFFPTQKAKAEGYDQILWTDSATHSIIEEAGTMNVFFYIKNCLITAPADEKILNGVTRKSIIDIAKRNKIKVEERYLTVEELKYYFKKNLVNEIFGSGTAVIINPLKLISIQNSNYILPALNNKNRISYYFKKYILDIQHNLSNDPFNWRFKISTNYTSKNQLIHF